MTGEGGYYLIARVRRRRGNRGEVVIEPMTPDRERFKELSRVLIGADPQSLKAFAIEEVWFHGAKTVVKLEGVDSIAEAEALTGLGLYVPEAEAIALPTDTYFQHDLIGMTVVDDARGVIGTVTSIMETGGTDLLVVEHDGKELLVPAAKTICVEVDVRARRIRVHLPEELYSINEV